MRDDAIPSCSPIMGCALASLHMFKVAVLYWMQSYTLLLRDTMYYTIFCCRPSLFIGSFSQLPRLYIYIMCCLKTLFEDHTLDPCVEHLGPQNTLLGMSVGDLTNLSRWTMFIDINLRADGSVSTRPFLNCDHFFLNYDCVIPLFRYLTMLCSVIELLWSYDLLFENSPEEGIQVLSWNTLGIRENIWKYSNISISAISILCHVLF